MREDSGMSWKCEDNINSNNNVIYHIYYTTSDMNTNPTHTQQVITAHPLQTEFSSSAPQDCGCRPETSPAPAITSVTPIWSS